MKLWVSPATEDLCAYMHMTKAKGVAAFPESGLHLGKACEEGEDGSLSIDIRSILEEVTS